MFSNFLSNVVDSVKGAIEEVKDTNFFKLDASDDDGNGRPAGSGERGGRGTSADPTPLLAGVLGRHRPNNMATENRDLCLLLPGPRDSRLEGPVPLLVRPYLLRAAPGGACTAALPHRVWDLMVALLLLDANTYLVAPDRVMRFVRHLAVSDGTGRLRRHQRLHRVVCLFLQHAMGDEADETTTVQLLQEMMNASLPHDPLDPVQLHYLVGPPANAGTGGSGDKSDNRFEDGSHSNADGAIQQCESKSWDYNLKSFFSRIIKRYYTKLVPRFASELHLWCCLSWRLRLLRILAYLVYAASPAPGTDFCSTKDSLYYSGSDADGEQALSAHGLTSLKSVVTLFLSFLEIMNSDPDLVLSVTEGAEETGKRIDPNDPVAGGEKDGVKGAQTLLKNRGVVNTLFLSQALDLMYKEYYLRRCHYSRYYARAEGILRSAVKVCCDIEAALACRGGANKELIESLAGSGEYHKTSVARIMADIERAIERDIVHLNTTDAHATEPKERHVFCLIRRFLLAHSFDGRRTADTTNSQVDPGTGWQRVGQDDSEDVAIDAVIAQALRPPVAGSDNDHCTKELGALLDEYLLTGPGSEPGGGAGDEDYAIVVPQLLHTEFDPVLAQDRPNTIYSRLLSLSRRLADAIARSQHALSCDALDPRAVGDATSFQEADVAVPQKSENHQDTSVNDNYDASQVIESHAGEIDGPDKATGAPEPGATGKKNDSPSDVNNNRVNANDTQIITTSSQGGRQVSKPDNYAQDALNNAPEGQYFSTASAKANLDSIEDYLDADDYDDADDGKNDKVNDRVASEPSPPATMSQQDPSDSGGDNKAFSAHLPWDDDEEW